MVMINLGRVRFVCQVLILGTVAVIILNLSGRSFHILTPFFSRVYKVVHKVESVSRLTHLLLDTPHGGYPVVTKTDADYEVFSGLISR